MLLDCIRDIHIVENNLDFNINRKIPFFDIKSEEDDSFKKYAENLNILFYEIITLDQENIKIKILGNEYNIKTLKHLTDQYLYYYKLNNQRKE